MTGSEIRKKIDENNKKMESIITTSYFTLNKEMQALIAENEKLAAECEHHFVNGKCIYCDTEAI